MGVVGRLLSGLVPFLFAVSSLSAGDSLKLIPEGDQLVWGLSRADLGRDYWLACRVVETSTERLGRMRILPGQRIFDPMWIRLRIDGDSLALLPIDPKRAERQLASMSRLTPLTRIPIISTRSDSLYCDLRPMMLRPHDGLDPLPRGSASVRIIDSLTSLGRSYAHGNYIEVDSWMTLPMPKGRATLKLRRTLYRLTEHPAQPREADARVGYKATEREVHGLRRRFIHRYDLSPESVARGKIHFYIDDRFSPLWQSAIKEGIESWNDAFRPLGLGDVVQTSLYSQASEGFDPEAGGINTFRYVESDFANAQGKHWTDPRSGEILEGEVLFSSSVIRLLERWYFLQTGATNPIAWESEALPDSIICALLRYASAHEVGHVLGLEHNYRGSFAYPTDSLRSESFARIHGTTASIMDYARMNYVARPFDGVKSLFPPRLGAYDIHAIAYGYSPSLGDNPEGLRLWLGEQIADPWLRYERLSRSSLPEDPSVQPTDLGSDGALSVRLAIANLKDLSEAIEGRCVAGIDPWQGLPATRGELLSAYYDLLGQLIPWIGGRMVQTLSPDGRVRRYDYVSPEKAREALTLLVGELMHPSLDLPKELYAKHSKRRQRLIDQLRSSEMRQRLIRSGGHGGLSLHEFESLLAPLLPLTSPPKQGRHP